VKNIIIISDNIGNLQIRETLQESLSNLNNGIKKVLLLPPDFTRFHSQAGKITKMY